MNVDSVIQFLICSFPINFQRSLKSIRLEPISSRNGFTPVSDCRFDSNPVQHARKRTNRKNRSSTFATGTIKDNFTKLKRKEKKIQLELRSLLSTFLTFARFIFTLDFFIIISK
jgi:hypothetical protein